MPVIERKRCLGRNRPPDYMVRLDLFRIVKIDGWWWAVRRAR